MKSILLIPFTVFIFYSCSQNNYQEKNALVSQAEKTIVIDSIEVLKENLILNQLEGKWYYNNKPFSGYSLKYHENDTLAEKLGYSKGKREGIARKWSKNGVLRIESYYIHNRLDSIYKSWWENGVLSAESHYVNGVKQGVEKEWYPTGPSS